MKIREYLQKKYGRDTSFGLLAVEAKALGIIYPLRKGWLEACEEIEISADQREKLLKALKSSKSEYAVTAIAALSGYKVVSQKDANQVDAERWRFFRDNCTGDMLSRIEMAFNSQEIDNIVDSGRAEVPA